MAAASDRLTAFHEAMSVFLGACDGPAAVVACDGDEAVAHLDRNGLRPLWLLTTKDYALAASELTGTVDLGRVEHQKLFGPGDTVVVSLKNGDVLLTDEVHRLVSVQRFPAPQRRVAVRGRPCRRPRRPSADLRRLQIAFGMTREDEQVLLAALADTGKPAVGSMGDDTPPAAMLDRLPRRLEDHFKLRFAQETSPPIDPIRDAWVFETAGGARRPLGALARQRNGQGERRRARLHPPRAHPLAGGDGGARGARRRRDASTSSSTRRAARQGLEIGARRRGHPRA